MTGGDSWTRRPRSLAVVLAVGVGTLVGCGGDADEAVDATGTTTPPEPTEVPALEGPFPLPFGIEQPDGLEPIGRPIEYVRTGFYYGGVPVELRSVRAAYRVTADDPPAVLRAWTDQLEGMALHRGTIGPGDPPELWVQATALPDFGLDGPGGSYAELQLWATDGDPILLVSLDQNEQNPPTPATFTDDTGDVARPSSVIEEAPRIAGDALFVEQGDTVHLPPGTRALMPTLPTSGGTGGSTSMLAADDGGAAVQSLLDEAESLNDFGDIYGHETTDVDGTVTTTATFNISAGGWGFHVVATQGPDDPYATVHVSSYAD